MNKIHQTWGPGPPISGALYSVVKNCRASWLQYFLLMYSCYRGYIANWSPTPYPYSYKRSKSVKHKHLSFFAAQQQSSNPEATHCTRHRLHSHSLLRQSDLSLDRPISARLNPKYCELYVRHDYIAKNWFFADFLLYMNCIALSAKNQFFLGDSCVTCNSQYLGFNRALLGLSRLRSDCRSREWEWSLCRRVQCVASGFELCCAVGQQKMTSVCVSHSRSPVRISAE